ASNEPPFIVTGMAIGITRVRLVYADVTIILDPAQSAVVRDVAPDQRTPVTHPHRSFTPQRSVVAHPVPDALQRRVALPSAKALVHDLPRRFRVGDRRLASPIAVAGKLVGTQYT